MAILSTIGKYRREVQTRTQVRAIGLTLLGLTLLMPAASAQETPSKTELPAAESNPDLQDSIAHDVLEPLQTAIQTHNLKQALSVFASDSGPQVRGQLRALFETFSLLQFRYKLTQVTSENEAVSATCEADLDAIPLDQTRGTLRHSDLLHLQLKHTPQGWKIAAFSPADFFAL